MKTGQAWLGAIAIAVAASWGADAAFAQSTDPGENLDANSVPGVSADAQISRNQDGEQDPNRGPVTNLPLPRYVSLKGSEGNARRGPSLSHRIDWVFRHAGMPLRVTAEFGQWRRVEDQDGAGGWVHYSLLSGVRTAIVQKDMLDLLAKPDPRANVIARAEAGAIVRLHECSIDWCRVSGGGEKGWVPKTAIWGADADEVRD
ncbi:MAG: SH3 domain-containing protein [Paracoccus sp. (in: a-proteobacteria)]